MSPLWLSKDITLGDWTSGFHCCIFLILVKNCFHSQLNFMSLMGHLPTIAFCYLVWMHYTESGMAFCISEWTDLSGYKQFYLYCARLNRVNIRMNFSSKRKAPNLWFKDLGAASAVVLDTGHFGCSQMLHFLEIVEWLGRPCWCLQWPLAGTAFPRDLPGVADSSAFRSPIGFIDYLFSE